MEELRNLTKIVRNMNLYKNKLGRNDLSDNEYEVCRYVTKFEGISQQEIASYLNVDKGLVSRIIQKLCNMELVMIKEDQFDKRRKLICPTDKSKNYKYETESEEVVFYQRIAKVLSQEEQNTLIHLIDKIYQESKRIRKNKFEGL